MAKDKTDVDPYLRSMMYEANKQGLVIPLTLYTQSFVVTGYLCTYKTYKKLLLEIYQERVDEAENQVRMLIEIFDAEHRSTDYIHLQRANWITPYYDPDGPPWRGRIKDIQGYIVGIAEEDDG